MYVGSRASVSDVVVVVKEHTHRTIGRAALGNIDLGQRLNAVLASVENLYLYIQQLFEHDKAQGQDRRDLKDQSRHQQKAMEM